MVKIAKKRKKEFEGGGARICVNVWRENSLVIWTVVFLLGFSFVSNVDGRKGLAVAADGVGSQIGTASEQAAT